MKQRLTREQLASILELEVAEIPLQQGPTTAHNARELDAFKAKCKLQYRTLAKRYHPDVGGDEEKMKVINQVIDAIMLCQPREMQPMVNRVVIVHSWTSAGTSTTWTGSSY